MAINQSLPPSFAVADATRNWFLVDGTPLAYSPREIISTAQAVVDVGIDGNWGTGTSDALIAEARRRSFPSKYIAAIEKAKADRRLNLDAWRAAIAIAYTVAPDSISFGTQTGTVQLPPYGTRAPGNLVQGAEGDSRTPPRRDSDLARPPAPRPPTTSIVALGLTRNQLIVAGVATLAVSGVVGYMLWKDSQSPSRPQFPAGRRLPTNVPPPRVARRR
jgi:hypothetical protein